MLRFKLEGARLLAPVPISDVYVPWRSGVEALYGLNGAGKSAILRATCELFRCNPRQSGYLIGRLIDDGVSVGVDDFTYAVQEEAATLLSLWPPDAAQVPVLDPPWEREGRTELDVAVGGLLAAFSSMPEPTQSSNIQFIDEALAQQIFTLAPHEEKGPEWSLRLGLLRSSVSPAISAEFDRIISTWDRFTRELEEAGEDVHSDGADELWRSRDWGLSWGDSLMTSITDLGGALRDGYLPDVQEEVDLLRRADTVPFRFPSGEMLWHLGRVSGNVATVTEATRLTIDQLEDRAKRQIALDVYRVPLPPDEAGESAAAGFGPLEVVDSEVVASTGLRAAQHAFGSEVSLTYSTVLHDAPSIFAVVAEPQQWLHTSPIKILASDGFATVSLSDLSEAQQRWAVVALALTLKPPSSSSGLGAEPYHLLALDEPDAALHASAERFAVEGLTELASSHSSTMFLVATHSKEFLNHPAVGLNHVYRNLVGGVSIESLSSPLRQRFDVLGLEPADALQLHQVILLVEGLHDEYILSQLLADVIADLRVLVVPLRGGRHLATVADSELLARFSNVPVIAVLDNLNADRVRNFWNEIQTSDAVEHDDIVKRYFSRKKSDEEQFVINFCRRVKAAGHPERFEVFGLSKGDIPEYLPVEAIVPGAESWEALRAEFDSQSRQANFKTWLRGRYGVEIDQQALNRGLADLSAVPDEFLRLAERCSVAGRRWRGRQTT